MTLIERLEWITELDDIDHDICDTARDAINEIIRLHESIMGEQKRDGLIFREFCDSAAEQSMIMSDDTPSNEWFINYIAEEWNIPLELAKICFEKAIKRLYE